MTLLVIMEYLNTVLFFIFFSVLIDILSGKGESFIMYFVKPSLYFMYVVDLSKMYENTTDDSAPHIDPTRSFVLHFSHCFNIQYQCAAYGASYYLLFIRHILCVIHLKVLMQFSLICELFKL